MRVVIELKRGEVPEVVLNNLYKQTQLQDTFGINMVALIDGQPQAVQPEGAGRDLPQHRREVVTRRTVFELRKARERGHVLEGLAVALANIDEFIATDQGLADAAGGQERADGQAPGTRSMVREMLARAARTAASAAATPTAPKAWRRSTACRPTACIACRTSRPRKSCRCACSA